MMPFIGKIALTFLDKFEQNGIKTRKTYIVIFGAKMLNIWENYTEINI